MGNDALYVPVRSARYAKTLNVLNELDKFGELGGAIYDEAANLSEPTVSAVSSPPGRMTWQYGQRWRAWRRTTSAATS